MPCKFATTLYKQGRSQRNKCFQNEFLRVVSVETWQNSSKIFLKFYFTTYLYKIGKCFSMEIPV